MIKFILRNSKKNIRIFNISFHFLVIVLPITIEIIALIASKGDLSSNIFIGTQLFVITALLLVLVTVSQIWLSEYHLRQTGKVRVEPFSDELQYCRAKEEALSTIPENGLSDDIYALIESPNANRGGNHNISSRRKINAANQKSAKHIAELVLSPKNKGHFKLLISGQNEDNISAELKIQQAAFEDIANVKGVGLSHNHFFAKRYLNTSLKDYLVVENFIFKTIRKTSGERFEDTFVLLENARLADMYREWIRDIYEHGKVNGLVDDEFCVELAGGREKNVVRMS